MQDRLRQETRTVWATAIAFVLGAGIGAVVLRGGARPLDGPGGASGPIAGIAAGIAAAAVVISSLQNRRGETRPMPPWQAVAVAAVSALGVLLAGVILTQGLQGFALSPLGGALLCGVAAATGGRFAYTAGVGVRTRDLSTLLFGFLTIGTLFAMATAADPLWWERNFSQLGLGVGG